MLTNGRANSVGSLIEKPLIWLHNSRMKLNSARFVMQYLKYYLSHRFILLRFAQLVQIPPNSIFIILKYNLCCRNRLKQMDSEMWDLMHGKGGMLSHFVFLWPFSSSSQKIDLTVSETLPSGENNFILRLLHERQSSESSTIVFNMNSVGSDLYLVCQKTDRIVWHLESFGSSPRFTRVAARQKTPINRELHWSAAAAELPADHTRGTARQWTVIVTRDDIGRDKSRLAPSLNR